MALVATMCRCRPRLPSSPTGCSQRSMQGHYQHRPILRAWSKYVAGDRQASPHTNAPAERECSMRIFVGSLALTTTEAELRHVFTPYGRVARVQILQDRETGRSRGFGFVEMPDPTEAQAAIAGLDGRSLDGRFLAVSEARQREDRGGPRQ